MPTLLHHCYLAGTACATLAAGGLWAGPLGWAGAGAGCVAGLAFSSLAKEVVHQYFRAPEPYPRQCGVRLHKFARGALLVTFTDIPYMRRERVCEGTRPRASVRLRAHRRA